MQPPLVAIVGPTASGKTELALRLAREQNAEIISVDSRQVYRYLAVGTAKPTGTWEAISRSPRQGVGRGPSYVVEGVPHHLIDFLDPTERFSAADFVRLATDRIAKIRARGKTPILAGGTGLYFKALTEGLAPMPPADEQVRKELRDLAEKRGRSYLHEELSRVDAESAARIPANNIQRVIRALEVHRLTGKPISQWHKEHQRAAPSPHLSPVGGEEFNFPPLSPLRGEGSNFIPRPPLGGEDVGEGGLSLTFIGLDPGKEELHRRIEERCRRMIADGLIRETRDLLNKGYAENCPALTGLGYPRVVAFLKGQLSKEDLLKYLIQDTRQYAKRQRTWFKHQMEIEWKK